MNFVEMENELLKWWYGEGIVEEYLHKNDKSEKKFFFMDGPITANNPMGVHHAWGRTYKDLWQRYKNMKGFKQRFQNGFDNQGLWVEVEVEKDKGFKTKKDIEDYGVEKFVNDCKERTIKMSIVQREQSRRLGYFMNWGDYDGSDYSVVDENKYSYYTMSSINNYHIWNFLKKCNDEGWLYKGVDGLPWCPRCGTAISQHEILTEEYKEVTHTSIFFQLPIKGKENEYLLVWTTTPWTLSANVAVAVHPELTYVKIKHKDHVYYLAEATLGALDGEYEVLERLSGTDLVGWEYVGPYDDLPEQEGAQHKVVPWEMVGEEEGTGMVHIAPGCGKEDFDLGKELGLKVVVPINGEGVYVEGFDWLTGMNVKDATPKIFEDVEKRGFLYKLLDYSHRYPQCWRCKTELLFRVVDEWFIGMDRPGKDGRTLRQRMVGMVSIAENDGGTKWIPEFGQERELDWLRNMHDWMISKKRYWGLALPIWECPECGNFEVFGSKEELKDHAVEGWEKFEGHTPHKPYIDEVKVKCSKCGTVAERVKDVGNPWLDAGIVTYSTLNYMTDRKNWESWFPADFVTECFPGQFKNWFYALIAMSAALEDKMPFKTLLGHALVKDEHGEEMHKSKGNSIAFDEAAEKMGADVMRWMYVRQNPRYDLNFGYTPAQEVKRLFYLMLWNSYKFLMTYVEINNWEPSGESLQKLDLTAMDKWILTRLSEAKTLATKYLDNYDAMTASRSLEDFVSDLSTWYIRNSRSRFAGKDLVAMEVLYYVLVELTKLLAPFVPFLSETMYQNLVLSINADAPKSVHLADYPEAESYDQSVLDQMATARRVVTLGQSARVESKMKVRQPLSELQVAGVELSAELAKVVADELNVKAVNVVEKVDESEGWLVKDEPGLKVSLNTNLTDEMKKEGLLREIVRTVQDMRKRNGFQMGEKVKIYWQSESAEVSSVFENMAEELKTAVSASEVRSEAVEGMVEKKVNEFMMKVCVVK